MARFFKAENNGIVAVISEDHAAQWKKVVDAGGDPIKYGLRIFTFCHPNRFRNEDDRHIYTGDFDDLSELMERGRHEFAIGGSSDWDGIVPFSNGEHFGKPDNPSTQEALAYRTTLRDAIDAFGITAVVGA